MSFENALKDIKTQTGNGFISLPVAQLLVTKMYGVGMEDQSLHELINMLSSFELTSFLIKTLYQIGPHRVLEVERIFLYLPAIEHENIAVLDMVIQDANLRIQGKLLIEEALFQNKFKAAQWLYENGARLDIKEDGYSILHNLIIENHVLGMEWILNKEPKHSNISGCLYSTLMTAIDFNRVEAFDLLLNFRADINAINPTGSYVAHYAVESPNNYFLSSLLKLRVDLDCFDANGMTPLLLGVYLNKTNVVAEILLNFPEKVYSVDYFGHDINYYVTNETDHTIVSLIRSVFSIMDMTK